MLVPLSKDLFVLIPPSKDLFMLVPLGKDSSLSSRNTLYEDKEH